MVIETKCCTIQTIYCSIQIIRCSIYLATTIQHTRMMNYNFMLWYKLYIDIFIIWCCINHILYHKLCTAVQNDTCGTSYMLRTKLFSVCVFVYVSYFDKAQSCFMSFVLDERHLFTNCMCHFQ